MKLIKGFLVAMFAMTGALTLSAVGDLGAADAKAHAKPGKPGKCGVAYYYSKKERMCLNATLK